MRHHHWLYGSPSYWPRPINGLYQCKTKQISPATPDLISIIHLIVSWCDLITPLSSYLFPINIHRIGAFSIEPSSQHWAGSSLAGSFRLISNEIELLWIFFASTPGFPQSAIKLNMSAAPRQAGGNYADTVDQWEASIRVTWLLSSNERARRRRANHRSYTAHRLNCSYFGVHGRNFWYINNVVDDPSGDYYK